MSVLSEYFDTLTLLEVMTDRDICNEKENKKKKQQQANKTNRQTKNEKQKKHFTYNFSQSSFNFIILINEKCHIIL